MDPLTSAAASGMRARMESLDMLANNLSNSSTGGFKADREFFSLYVAPEASGDVNDSQFGTMPLIDQRWTDFSQGTLQNTTKPLDLALSGPGFFGVNGPNGTLYTRNGNFQVDALRTVMTTEGYPVRLTGGAPLQLQSDAPADILSDGTVLQAGQTLGKLELSDFPGNTALSKVGANFFRASNLDIKPAVPEKTALHQGKLETSNVSNAESAVRMISVLRQFEMLQKAVMLGGEMNRRALEEVARV